jgi:hypothetical protein
MDQVDVYLDFSDKSAANPANTIELNRDKSSDTSVIYHMTDRWKDYMGEGHERHSNFATVYQGYRYGGSVKGAIEKQLQGLGFNLELDDSSNASLKNLSELLASGFGIAGSLSGKHINENWHEGSFENPESSLENHYAKHGPSVNATSKEQYFRKALEFSKNLRGAKSSPVSGQTPGVTRYVKQGKFIDIARDKRIVSFGTRE